jgi:hypothetical protein
MSQVITLLGIGLLAYLYFQSEAEKYQPGPSTSVPVPVTHALVHKFVQLAQPAVVKQLGGTCPVYPIETSYIRQDGDVFHCRFMFTVMPVNQYPYGLEAEVDIQDNQVIRVTTQPVDTDIGDVVDDNKWKAFGHFDTGAQLKQEPLPTLNQLQSVFALS